MSKRFFEIAVNTPFNNSLLTYETDSDYKIGDIVEVPLGKRTETGVIYKETKKPQDVEIKEVEKKSLYPFSFFDWQIQFLDWMSGYYQYPLGQLFKDVLPKALKKPREVKPRIGKGEPFSFELNPEQQETKKFLLSHLDHFQLSLIHGITGSGKTVVYIEVIKEVLKQGKSVLVLLPEINLTPQFLSVFEKHLSCEIISYSSAVSNSVKFQTWHSLASESKPRVIIGARSSLFLPLQNLGLIVVDEEHDQSFKQNDRCQYHARDAAIKLASQFKIPIILGSATPSLESLYNIREKKRGEYLRLTKRTGEASLPEIELLDTTKDMDDLIWPFHPKSLEKIREAFEKKEQVLVFVNRLGFASHMQCRSCGHQFYCPSCSVPLKLFKRRHELKCQTCDHRSHVPESCPACGNLKLLSKGFGTERLQMVLESAFPKHRIGRFDRDDVTTFNELNKRLDDFHEGKLDLLVGTQMLSKGHNFEKVNLVIILGADSQLNFPDFRSSEKVMQQVMQVAGRSGRYQKDSLVLVQTLNPENSLYRHLKDHDFDGFIKDELQVRELCRCSPFFRLCNLSLTSKHQNVVVEEAKKAQLIFENLQDHFKEVEVLGPRPALIEKRANKFSWCFFLRSQDMNQLHNLIKTFRTHYKPHYSLSIKYDIDPMSFE